MGNKINELLDSLVSELKAAESQYRSEREEAIFEEDIDTAKQISDTALVNIRYTLTWQKEVIDLQTRVEETKLFSSNGGVTQEVAPEEILSEEPQELVMEMTMLAEVSAEEPIMEEVLTEEAIMEEVLAEEPIMEEAPVEEPIMEEIPVEEPIMEESPVEEPIMEEIPVEEPILEEVPVVAPTSAETATLKVVLFDKPHQVAAWSDVLVVVCEVLIEQKPLEMMKLPLNKELNTAERTNFSRIEKDITINGKKLTNGMWIEAEEDENYILETCNNLLSLCGFESGDISVTPIA